MHCLVRRVYNMNHDLIKANNDVVAKVITATDQDDNYLEHYGMPRRSGRYPWGSGGDPYQRSVGFTSRVDELKKSGWTETPENIMKEFGLSTNEYRAEKSRANAEVRCYNVNTAKRLMEKEGLGATEIGRKMGVGESTVRSWLNEESAARMNIARQTADFLKKQADEKGMIDVGAGVERELGISKERLRTSLKMLEEEGYPVYKGGIPQVTNPGQQSNQTVLCKPGTQHKEIYNYENVKSVADYYSHDGGKTFSKFVYPKSMDSKRLKVRYRDDEGPDGFTGDQKDGIVELRRGVNDLSLGNSKYAQVRILVDGTHYIKGMAVYSDKMPDGVDVVFNTNKPSGTPTKKVLKAIKDDPENPFGSLIQPSGQSTYVDKNGKKQLSLINKRADEGDWTGWKDALPSQFLAKQSKSMAKKQLNLAKANKQLEFEEINSLILPTVKRHLLNKFADECDSAAVHLKAAKLPGQKYHVIIPVNSLKDTEVYAPGYRDGTKLALIRYPHGGTFEIPILTVNNKNAIGKKLIGKTSIDAVGINKKNADRLSGADFDGDTVMCIPTHDRSGKVKITSTPKLKGLENFDPKTAYPAREGMTVMTKHITQKEMGVISNLITDMTLSKASSNELAAAVRHSMVVIDAEKHKLNYKQSEIDNNISALKKKYQTKLDADGNEHTGGSSTLISRAKGRNDVPKRQGSPHPNIKGTKWYDPSRPEGALIYKTSDKAEYTVTKVNKRTGEVKTIKKTRTQRSTNMAETDDARTLVSTLKHPMELEYADYANNMKSLANKARVAAYNTGKVSVNKNAKTKYKDEVASLDTKLHKALLNTPKEREALRRANAKIAEITKEYELDEGDLKKARQREITNARADVGSVARRERNIEITDKEWEAIMAGAVSDAKLTQILNNTDIDKLRERATPKQTSKALSAAKVNQIKAMSNTYSLSEIAAQLGVSTSTVSKYLKGGS